MAKEGSQNDENGEYTREEWEAMGSEATKIIQREDRENPPKTYLPKIDDIHLPGGREYHGTKEGKPMFDARRILARTYEPGDILKMNYIFDKKDEPEIPEGMKVEFVGWKDVLIVDRSDGYVYWTGEEPGVFRNYDALMVRHDGEIKEINSKDVVLADEETMSSRLQEWGDKQAPNDKLVRVGDLPEDGEGEISLL